MQRRSFLAVLGLGTLCASALASRPARADIVYEPPPRLEVRPESLTYTAAPTALVLRVTNTGASALEVSGPRLVVVTGGVRVPVRITRLEVEGRARGQWDPIGIPAGATIRVALAIGELPATSLAAGRLDFALRFQGAAEATFSLSDARR